MKILGLIPARGGSKGVPKKNIKLLGKKPLIEYTLDDAKNSKLLTEIVVSTDDEEIAIAARMLMIATTISISTKVKAFRVRFISGHPK